MENFTKVHPDFGNSLSTKLMEYRNVSIHFTKQQQSEKPTEKGNKRAALLFFCSNYFSFLNDVTAAILVPQKKETAAMLPSRTILLSCVLAFVTINLHGCWLRE